MLDLVLNTLESGGALWIADAGQSDFSAAVLRAAHEALPVADLKDRFHVVQHADWNEEVTTPEDLAYVKEAATYHRTPEGNAVGNGSPGFQSDEPVDGRSYVEDPGSWMSGHSPSRPRTPTTEQTAAI